MRKRHLDEVLIELELAASAEEAMLKIARGEVYVNGNRELRPKLLVDPARLNIEYKPAGVKYVGRGALKLAAAAEAFNLDFKDMTVVDIGASTGGFTDYLLQNGAKKIYAVDVGYGQLDPKLRADVRVINMERTDIRTIPGFTEAIDLVVCDVSFISLRQVLPAVAGWHRGRAVVLYKPQFEATKAQVGIDKGVIRDETVRMQLLAGFKEWLASHGYHLDAETTSPIKGDKGNVEYLFLINLQP